MARLYMYTEYTTIDNRHTHPVGVMNVIKDWIDLCICCEQHFKQPYAETWNGGGHGVIICSEKMMTAQKWAWPLTG